jgi:hypothetical protein
MGVIHTEVIGENDPDFNNPSTPIEVILNEGTDTPIIGKVWREKLIEYKEEDNPEKTDHVQIIVHIEYTEPPLLYTGWNQGEITNRYSLIGYWVPSTDS